MTTDVPNDPVSLICSLCDKTYQYKDGPLMLPCLHSFCKSCLARHIKKNQLAVKISCPSCKSHFPHPSDVSHFPLNLRLSHLAENKELAGGNAKCQKCEGTPQDATFFLYNYSMFLCSKCKNDYHRFVNVEDLEFGDLAKIEKGEAKLCSSSFSKCPQHKEKLILFCEVCSQLICMTCAQTKHQYHKKSSPTEKSDEEKKALQEHMDSVNDALDTMNQTLQQIELIRDSIKVSAREATKRINKACDDLTQAVENKRKHLLETCQEIAEGKDEVLLNQAHDIEHLRKELGFVKLHAIDAINNHCLEEILSVKESIKCRLNQTMEIYQGQSMELTENDTIDTSLEIEPVVKKIQSFGFFCNVPYPSECHVDGLALPLANVGKEKKVTVVLKDKAGKQIDGKACFQYHLRRVSDDPECESVLQGVTVTQSDKRDGTATLTFTPNQSGKYELTIMVRNRPIANPYVIHAQQPRDYRNFHNVQVITKDIGGHCRCVAVHDNGSVYATDCSNHTIKVFRQDGTKDRIGGPEKVDGELNYPWGITILENTLYVVSNSDHMVKKYSTNGRLLGEFGGNGSENGQFSNPRGICTDGRRILVADHGNKRIQIFTAKGEFISSFQCSNNPDDVAVDPVGNVHVALYYSHHIAVYSQDGSQIETYNLGGKLQYPTGICVDGIGNRLIGTYGVRFLGTYSAGQVYIADSAGTLISSRQVSRSWGVTMDKKGVIYVAEWSNCGVSLYTCSSVQMIKKK